MMPTASERPDNTPAQVSDYLRDAMQRTIDACGEPPSSDVFFAQALALVSAKKIMFEQVAPGLVNMVVPKGM